MTHASAPAARWGVALLLVFAALAAWFEVHNLDLPLHARTGEWIVQHGEVPTTNVLSHLHHDHPMVADKWLFQVAAHALHDGVGLDAVLLARVVLVLALAWGMASLARERGAGPAALLALCVLGLVAARARLFFRPDLVSLVFVVLVARSLLGARKDDTSVPWWLVGLQVVWVNVHGYFTLGPLVTFAVAAGHLVGTADDRRRALRLGRLGVVLVAACFVNPSGWRGAYHPVAILDDLSQHYDFYTSAIVEFLPTFADDPRGPYDRLAFFVLLPVTAVALGADVLRRRRDPDAWAALLVALLLGAMSTSLRRNMSPFAVVVAPLAAGALTRMAATLLAASTRLGTAGALLLAAVAAFGEVSDHTSIHDGLDRRWGWGRSRLAYPDAGIDFIAEHLGDRRTVFTSFSFGSAFTGARYPDQATATDGNTHGYPTAYLQEVTAAISQSDPDAFDRLVARDGHEVALLGAATPLSVALMLDPEWTLVSLGRHDAVYVRDDAVPADWLTAHDLEARLAAGELPPRDGTPPPRFGWSAWEPRVELDQATLFAGGGHVDAARVVLDEALAAAPDDGPSLALAGLLALRATDTTRARELLRRAREVGGHHALVDAVDDALERLGEG